MNTLIRFVVLLTCLSAAHVSTVRGDDVATFVEASCIGCHGEGTETGLNFKQLGEDLSDRDTFRAWEKVFDRVTAGEMPPASEERPDQAQLHAALSRLKRDLRTASMARQEKFGRVPARRLTRLELGYTLQDLLLVGGDLTADVPAEVESGSFDTVGSVQRISAVHMESYLKAADAALDQAIQLGRNPVKTRKLEFIHNPFLNEFHDKPLRLGGNVSRRIEDGVALFRDVDYLITSRIGGFNPSTAGEYRITSKVAAYQSRKPITVKLIRKGPGGEARLLLTRDLVPGKTETVVVTTWLKPGDTFYTTFEMAYEPFAAIAAAGGVKNYKGPGIAVKSQQVQGPLHETWPPPSTRQLLDERDLRTASGVATKLDRVDAVVRRLAPRIFRRPATEAELRGFIDLAGPAIEADRNFVDVLRVPLRAMLSSPQFLLFGGQPGELDAYALASRLSYFLTRSMPDAELMELAERGTLTDRAVLAQQVDRLLASDKSRRFISDFLGQWLRLYQVDATSPDQALYPEYDELLGDALVREPELFFAELIRENLSLSNVIDSDFTFVNRRLAEHYGIRNVEGQHFRRVPLPEQSPRGGVLTQAAVLKTTANGTVTSPVTRGNFVLTSILGTPPSPPPPSVGSIEPDTRGQTTIREILAAHRNIETCAKCHRSIDPPGFALESFDPIGGFRTRYRATGGGGGLGALFGAPATYRQGPKVDPSGTTSDGQAFDGIDGFRKHLLNRRQQVARHFISQLVVYSTGGEIEFADRKEIEALVTRTAADDFKVRDMIHAVVQSPLFRSR